ncbi:hypothetical protein CPLU01_00626 [Colletotrichum plurivorum]|uniref:Secreted protein n=1 Tax=Colletotrichum plurivorum TaxID=2175906 RepID=A0A8H6NRY3_9PEZI|nr:hypothetical protein CPLU01_00626 [Colletotrichum plurivorum]
MKASVATAILAYLAGTAMAAATDSGLTETTENVAPYPMGLIGWEGPLYEGGPDVHYEGVDLEDIDRQIQADHPGLSLFDDSLNFPSRSQPDNFVGEEAFEEPTTAGHLQARQSWNTLCDLRQYGGVQILDAMSGVRHLRSVSNRCVVQARQCIRTTCNNSTAIVMCNDRTFAWSFTCSHIANVADAAVAFCMDGWSTPSIAACQRFHPTDGYNVIVGSCKYFSPSGQPV